MKIHGTVIHGKNKGKKIGFSTANIELAEKVESGVYAGKVIINDQEHKAGIFVNNEGTLLEAHIIGFSGDLYGEEIEVEIEKKIREIIKFSNDKDLIAQISRDISEIKKIKK